MKRLLLILPMLALIFLAGCKKFLDKEPTSFLSPQNYYTNESDVKLALAGVYEMLGNETMWGGQIPIRHNITTDESYYSYTKFSGGPFWYNYDAADPYIRGMWANLYQSIERANMLLANIGKADMDSTKKSVARGEALFLRAFYYFTLVQYWGDVPLKLTPSASVNNVDIARTPAREVYAQILKDMEEAEKLVKTATEAGISGEISKSTVRGILARVCLTMAGEPLKDVAKYNDARNWANKVKESNEHMLNPDFKQVFINEMQDVEDFKECIWEVECYGTNSDAFREGGRMGNENGVTCSNLDTGYAYGMNSTTWKLFKLYTYPDVRRDWAIAPYYYSGNNRVNFAASTIYNRSCGKWRRTYELLLPKNKNYTPTNFPMLRYSDVLLMLAEAENEVSGPTALAHQALNMVRNRAHVPDTTISDQTGFRLEIQNERARELCFEGLRKPDLIRWGIFLPALREAANEFRTKAPGSFLYAVTALDNASAKHLLYPIPMAELSLNKAITQNPGW